MANNMIMASAKPIISLPTTTRVPKAHLQLHLPKITKITKTQLQSFSSSALKSISIFAASSLALVPPSLAETEKAVLFEFDLTLPIMMAQFLLLMVALDKLYFTPLGKFMDERDASIKSKLADIKDTTEEVKKLEEQAEAVVKAAMAEVAAALNQKRRETQEEVEKILNEGKARLEKELMEALANLEREKQDTIKALDAQAAVLSDEIVKKVLPVKY